MPTASSTVFECHKGSRFGLLIVGEPDSTAIPAREVVNSAFVSEGHPTEIIPGLEAVPRREDVLRICAQHTLDGLAFVSVRRGDEPAVADVVVRDANGDPFRDEVAPEREEGRVLRTPLSTQSKATLTVPAPESAGGAEPRPAPVGPLPPLLWFDERDGNALLGERLLAAGEVYRLLGRPDLELSFQRRMRAKHALLATGIAASTIGVLLAPVLWNFSGHSGELGWRSSDRAAKFFYIDGAILALGIADRHVFDHRSAPNGSPRTVRTRTGLQRRAAARR